MTKAETEALEWLRARGGDGVFGVKGNQTLLVRGEFAPFMRSTWNALVKAGKCELYGQRRLRVKQ